MTAAFGNDSHGDLRHQPQRKLAAAGATDAPTCSGGDAGGESKASPRARVAPSAAEDSAEKSGRKRRGAGARPDTVTPAVRGVGLRHPALRRARRPLPTPRPRQPLRPRRCRARRPHFLVS
eukprot:gene9907-biopygen6806